jgi:hypothetical protein
MREKDGLYECIAVFFDELLIAAKDPESITKALKGAGPLTYHLGCDYFRDSDVTLC